MAWVLLSMVPGWKPETIGEAILRASELGAMMESLMSPLTITVADD